MKITSSAFKHGERIPSEYSRYNENHSPPLSISEIPPEAQSVVVIMDDPDAPHGTFTHWVMFNVDRNVGTIHENHPPRDVRMARNDWGESAYGGPRPPSGSHRYFFTAYALDSRLDLPDGCSRGDVETAMEGHVIASTQLMGTYAAPMAADRS